MRETQIVARIRQLAEAGYRDKSLIQGIGDDCAILRPRPKEDLVFTSDFVIENRHFRLQTHSALDIGHKALARSLSDLAAMGSDPVFCLVSLAIPAELAGSWVRRFFKGLLALAAVHKIALAGGDLARTDKVIADVTCCGRVPRGKAILRSNAKPGDRIYVTGELGASAFGLGSQTGRAWRSHLRPEPRISEGRILRHLGVAAGMDLSDGLSLDLQRLCLESSVGAEIVANPPIATGATLEMALHGGEDYELLFTAPPRLRIPQKLGNIPVTPIGVITRDHPGQVYFGNRPLKAKGFDHFQ